jgi:hypothetical protein
MMTEDYSNPIDYLIRWFESAVHTGQWKISKFTILNAKDELKRLRQDQEHYQALKDKDGDTNRWLSCEKELAILKEENKKLKQIFENPVAYCKTNDRHDLYDLRIMNNPYNDQTKVVPLYSNREEFLNGDWKGYNHYGKFNK